jgi:hypothetical protein
VFVEIDAVSAVQHLLAIFLFSRALRGVWMAF